MKTFLKITMLCCTLIPTACDLPAEVDGEEPNAVVVAEDAQAGLLKQQEEAEPDDDSEHDRFSEEAAELSLSIAPDPTASGVCCAWCWNRSNYYQMVGVTANCTYWASAWCSQNGRGGLYDAKWGSCNPPPGGF